MPVTTKFTVRSILKNHKDKVMITWLMVVLENILMVLLPLSVGFAIDSLLNGELTDLYFLPALLTLLVVVSVVWRFYDTRVYGAIRVEVGEAVDNQMRHHPMSTINLSTRNARLDMSRELVDFLENDIPSLLTALIQLIASVIILAIFHIKLGISAVIAGIVILIVYARFHGYFIRLNSSLNNRMEDQVTALSRIPFYAARCHLERIKRWEIMISDAEAILYGLILLVLFGFVIINLWLSTLIHDPTAGQIFSIVTYSLEFVEAAVLLLITLQTLSRLTEISQRLSKRSSTPSTELQQEINQ